MPSPDAASSDPSTLVKSLSHVTFSAHSESLHDLAVEFYKKLGFIVVASYDSAFGKPIPRVEVSSKDLAEALSAASLDPTANNNSNNNVSTDSSTNTHPVDYTEATEAHTVETWLHLFPNAMDSVTLKSQSGLPTTLMGATIRIAVEPSRAVQRPDCVAQLSGNLRKQHVALCLTVQDIKSLETTLSAPFKKYEYQTPPTTDRPLQPQTDLFTVDPLGNLLLFTNKMSPFTTSHHSSNVIQIERPVPVTSTVNKTIEPHKEGSPESPTETRRRRIGILTSGGDSSGMNAAVRAITRYSLQKGCQPYAIFEGYQGLVEGGSKISRIGWEDVRGLLAVGGTSIGTARCAAFRERAGRLKATLNLIKAGIDALIVIGGDGSLTGADMLRSEWSSLVDELFKNGQVSEDERMRYSHLTIVGLVGSIDNDMSSTDITIGAVTSLHRICESLDSLTSTALSHQRAFVVEVMGRHCGWLALMAAIAVGADWVFLPERPPPLTPDAQSWEDEMCSRIQMQRSLGNRKTIIIVCEGAIDRQLKPIKSDYIKSVIETKLGLDTRVTNLGHVQRGGTPCAFDRYLGTVQGVEAVEAVLRATPTTPSPMIGLSQRKITCKPLMEAVRLTHTVSEAISKKDFKRAMELRDPDFNAAYEAFVQSTVLASEPGGAVKDGAKRLRIGILHVGAPAGGMNAATRTAVRLCLNRGHTPLGIYNGFSGLVSEQVKPLTWQMVSGWTVRGGSELGTNRDQPAPLQGTSIFENSGMSTGNGSNGRSSDGKLIDLGLIAYHLQKHRIDALLVIGGFEAYTSLLVLSEAQHAYPAFAIPMVHLPATISNNVPGTDYSIGSDTALNAIVEACDRIKQSAAASRSRVFVVEVQGGNCGYLAVLGGLATGATTVYIPEEGITLDMLSGDVRQLCRRYAAEAKLGVPSEGRVILRNEATSKNTYTTEVISSILRAEGTGLFDSRTAILGHLQQGGIPSPLDRIRAVRFAVNCIDWIESQAVVTHYPPIGHKNISVIGIRGAEMLFTPVRELVKETNLKKRKGKDAWWIELKGLISIMSKYQYFGDTTQLEVEEKPINMLKDSYSG